MTGHDKAHKWQWDLSSLSPVRSFLRLYFTGANIYSLFSGISISLTSPFHLFLLIFWKGTCVWVLEQHVPLAPLWALHRLGESREAEKKRSQRKIPASHSFDGRQLKHIHLFINTFHFPHGISMSSFLCSIAHCWWKPLLVTAGFSTFPRPHVWFLFQFTWWTLIYKLGFVNVWLEVKNYVRFLETVFSGPCLSPDWHIET